MKTYYIWYKLDGALITKIDDGNTSENDFDTVQCQKVLFFITNPVFGKYTTCDLLFKIPSGVTKVTFPCYIGNEAVSM